jgi:hypothetical protein
VVPSGKLLEQISAWRSFETAGRRTRPRWRDDGVAIAEDGGTGVDHGDRLLAEGGCWRKNQLTSRRSEKKL